MNCAHCNESEIKVQLTITHLAKQIEHQKSFCSLICLLLYLIDDIRNQKKYLEQLVGSSWLPVIREFHDQMIQALDNLYSLENLKYKCHYPETKKHE